MEQMFPDCPENGLSAFGSLIREPNEADNPARRVDVVWRSGSKLLYACMPITKPFVSSVPSMTYLTVVIKAVAEMVRQLRKTSDRTTATHGLILANGGTLTTENAICLSTQPRQSSTSYPLTDTLPSRVRKSLPPAVDAKATGEAVIEVRKLLKPLLWSLY